MSLLLKNLFAVYRKKIKVMSLDIILRMRSL